ncbi:MAG: pantetheine-phosphate adenylyltransferase [Thiotrichaceae bacterium]|nr:pantetheine-phosphate adenylyltransferase [Thiotrichaceae bacterium]PCI14790.1 MAG: pantetheine-phosphate adenylyltransferase [Thiotrichales bacterium]
MGKIAIYPGTFDPLTNGHSDLVQRAARLFDHVIVAVATNPGKAPQFSADERIKLAQIALDGIRNIEVCGFNQLLVDFAHKKQASVIVRGLRAVSDFEYEFQLAGMNRKLAADIETLFLMPAEKYSYLSSSLVREISSFGGDISAFVHPEIETALCHKMR